MEITKELAEKIADNLEALFIQPEFIKKIGSNEGIILSKDREKIAKEILKGVQSAAIPSIANDSILEVFIESDELASGETDYNIIVSAKKTDTGEILFELSGKTPSDIRDKIRGKLW